MSASFIVGITGSVASGKSRVSEILKAGGYAIVDADVVSREVVAKDTQGFAALKEVFPEAFKGGDLNRKKLRESVFADEEKLKVLNNITHPLIYDSIMHRIEQAQEKLLFLIVPLLFETVFHKVTDFDIVVAADYETRIKRLIFRDNITRELAEKMIASQLPQEQKIALADYVLHNNGNIAELGAEIQKMLIKVNDIVKQSQ